MMENRRYVLRNVLLVVGSLLVFAAIIYASFAGQKSYTNLSVEEVHARINSGKSDYVLVDVRTLAEYTGELGHLPEALLYPVQEIDTEYHQLDQFKKQDKELIVYCRSGNRSRRASQFLFDHGFKKVYNMEGGMRAWNAAYGRPEHSDAEPPNLKGMN
ncbi:MAG: rhodanese-like domain-containing protein [Calditrichota bacterium]